MGCGQSKKKSKSKRGEKKETAQQRDGGNGSDLCLQKQLERFEWQLRILEEVLSACGNPARAELLKEHADEEVCALVLGILDQVKSETAVELNALHQQRSRSAAKEQERQLIELQNNHQEETRRLTESFQASERVLQAKVGELTEELRVFERLKTRVQASTLKRDLQRNIQTHGSPGAFWESEQESLLFVIEMKMERLQEQSRKLQEMQELVEKNLALEDQIIQILQQNEDLKVRNQNSQTLIQRMSKEQQDLQVALERQMSVNRNLSQEKEELVFKLRHRGSCPSLQLAAVSPS